MRYVLLEAVREGSSQVKCLIQADNYTAKSKAGADSSARQIGWKMLSRSVARRGCGEVGWHPTCQYRLSHIAQYMFNTPRYDYMASLCKTLLRIKNI